MVRGLRGRTQGRRHRDDRVAAPATGRGVAYEGVVGVGDVEGTRREVGRLGERACVVAGPYSRETCL